MSVASRPLPVIPATRQRPPAQIIEMPTSKPAADAVGGLNLTTDPLLRFLLTDRRVQPVFQILSVSFLA